jgi:ATP-dependent DNA helicase Q4
MKRSREVKSAFSSFQSSSLKIAGMEHLFTPSTTSSNNSDDENNNNDENSPSNIIIPPKRRRLNNSNKIASCNNGESDIFEKASIHMTKIAEQEIQHNKEKENLKKEMDKYEKRHGNKESHSDSKFMNSKLREGVLSNNFVKTNMKRKKVQRKRIKKRKEKRYYSPEKNNSDGESTVTEKKVDLCVEELAETMINEILDSETCDNALTSLLKKYFGYNSFRDGQLEAIRRIIHGQSTLLIQPTGSGKSLCYQIPALVMTSAHFQPQEESEQVRHRIALVISPLISLMRDQMQQLPECLPGASLFANQTINERTNILDDLRNGQVKVLFISPERLCTDTFLGFVQSSNLDIVFACVDEAHCVSEWSHNFRPSYLHIRSALNQLGVQNILALTATATLDTQKDMCSKLFVTDTEDSDVDRFVIRGTVCRDNLILSCSLSGSTEERFNEVVKLLQSDKFKDLDSIIIYSLFKNDTDSLANHLKLYLKGSQDKIRSYHAGLSASERKTVENQFLTGKIRIIVSTVAFGMGINKSDVRSVIHFNLPRSVENYVQEIGRAGRDGEPSPCHLFLSTDDAIRLRSLAFGERINEIDVKRFIRTIVENGIGEFVFSVNELQEQLDMPFQVIRTLLTHLELNSDIEPLLLCNSQTKCRYSVFFLNTHPAVLAKSNKLVQAILSCKQQSGANGKNIFDIPDICKATNKSLRDVEKELEGLKDSGEIKYEATGEAFSVSLLRLPSAEEQSQLCKWLISKVRKQEANSLWKIDEVYKLAITSAPPTLKELTLMTKSALSIRQTKLQENIESYFTVAAGMTDSSDQTQSILIRAKLVKINEGLTDRERAQLLQDIYALLRKHGIETLKNGKVIARILHGLSSPAYTSDQWYQGSNCWGRYKDVDFPTVEALATRAIIDFKSK